MRDNWFLTVAATGLLAATAHADVVGKTAHPPSAKQQLIDCMNKRMSASRTLSYNDASKICKEQATAQIPLSASSTP